MFDLAGPVKDIAELRDIGVFDHPGLDRGHQVARGALAPGRGRRVNAHDPASC